MAHAAGYGWVEEGIILFFSPPVYRFNNGLFIRYGMGRPASPNELPNLFVLAVILKL